MASNVVNDPQRISYPVISTSDISANNQVIGFRNRIINGAMRIDQRNVGAAVSLNAATSYITDRFYCNNALSIATTFQQGILGNSGFPPRIANQPFTHCLTWTNSSTASTATNSIIYMLTNLEGNSVVDLNWGFAGARMITLSFWAYVSVVGTYSVCLQNNGLLTGYVTTFQVTTANMWQKINISIPGPLIGTWATDTSLGIEVTFALHGSTVSAATSSLNTWQTTSTQYYVSTTQTNLALTASSTFSITGVQLEVGTLATNFEWRPWETEMRMCQRYYEKSYDYGTAVGSVTNLNVVGNYAFSNGFQMPGFVWKVEKRVAPSSATIYSPITANTTNAVSTIGGSTNLTTALLNTVGTKGVLYITNLSGLAVNVYYIYHYTVSADF